MFNLAWGNFIRDFDICAFCRNRKIDNSNTDTDNVLTNEEFQKLEAERLKK